MSGFAVGLWESVFQPGTSPQLIIATHVSFVALLATLGWLIYVTKGNIHFILLFIIATLLWCTIIWFVNELKQVKLQNNNELGESDESKPEDDKKENDTQKTTETKSNTTATSTSTTKTRSRKA